MSEVEDWQQRVEACLLRIESLLRLGPPPTLEPMPQPVSATPEGSSEPAPSDPAS